MRKVWKSGGVYQKLQGKNIIVKSIRKGVEQISQFTKDRNEKQTNER